MCRFKLSALSFATMACVQEDFKDRPCVHKHVMGTGKLELELGRALGV
jgi:hypothetical protein